MAVREVRLVRWIMAVRYKNIRWVMGVRLLRLVREVRLGNGNERGNRVMVVVNSYYNMQ